MMFVQDGLKYKQLNENTATTTVLNNQLAPGCGFECPNCGRVYKLKSSLRNHQKWECGKEPQFRCPHCAYKAKQKMHIARHMERMHKDKCPDLFKSSDVLSFKHDHALSFKTDSL